MSDVLTLYEKGHLVAAAIRLHNHLHHTPPSPEQLAEVLAINVEQVHHVVNKMAGLGALKVLTGAFGTKVLLADHLLVEELEGADAKPDIDDEVAAFQAAQAEKNEEVAARFDKNFVDERKTDLQSEVAAKLADPSKLKRSDNPLDAMFKKKG